MKSSIAICATVLLAIPAAATAHVFVEQSEQPADGYPLLDFIVPHGCDGSATTSVTVKIPETVPAVTPQRSPFYTLSTKEGPKEEVELFGETITKGISEVTWTAKEPLADNELDTLGLELKLPNTPGETLYFPTIQKCEKGQIAWIEIPAEGQTEEDLESPAPTVTLTEAEDGHGGGEETASKGGDDEDEKGAPTWLAILGVALGAAGLGAGFLRKGSA